MPYVLGLSVFTGGVFGLYLKKVEKLYSTPTGYQYVVFLTIYVDGEMSTFLSHKLADSLEKDICMIEKVSKAVIHVNPIEINKRS